jgi:uncharacterized repeat protein (TIGR01451 family)
MRTDVMMIVLISVLVSLLGGRPAVGQEPSMPESQLVPASPEATDAVPDDSFWNNTGLLAGANQSIRALSFMAGDLYVGGGFDRVAGIVANRTAYWDGQQWHAMGSGVSGLNAVVEDLDASTGGNVYVVGTFSSAGGQAADSIARWNTSSEAWFPLATSVNGSVDAVIVVPTAGGDTVYVGGAFTQIDGVSANRVAKWRNGVWTALGSGLAGGDAPRVHSLSFNPANVPQIVAGGRFATAGGASANNVALWSGSGWSSLGSGTSNGVDGVVKFLDFRGTNFVVVGGSFLNAGTINQARGSALWQGGNTWSLFTGKGTNGEVRGIIENATRTYVGGTFTNVTQPNSNIVGAAYLAQWDGNIWETIPSSPNASVLRMERAGNGSSSFFLAGSFGTAGGMDVGFIALFTPSIGTGLNVPQNVFFPLGGGLEGSSAKVYAIQPHSDGIYVGGRFSIASDQFVNNIALFNRTSRTWSLVPGNAGTGKVGTNDDIYALALRGNELIMGGEFTEAGGVPAAGVASYNTQTDTWSALATTINGNVNAVAVNGTDIYIGGEFTEIDGVTVNHVARWNGSAWTALGTGTDGAVNAVLFKNGFLYVGGLFANAGGAPASNIARFNTTNSTWGALGVGADDEVLVLNELFFGTIGVGGKFNTAGGVTGTSGIATLNTSISNPVWAALGTGTDGNVTSIKTRGNDIYIGGLFNRMLPDISVNHVARWNGTAWLPLGSGVAGTNLQNSEVGALSVVGDSLFVGGRFTRAGDKTSRRFAEWVQPEVDLSASLSSTPSPVNIGNQITYVARIRNLGTINASPVSFSQTFASSLVFGPITTTQGSCSFSNATTLNCGLGTLTPNQTVTVTVVATTTVLGLIGSTGTASSPATEAFPSNNTSINFNNVIVPGNPIPAISSLSPSSFVRQEFNIPPPPAVKITVNGTGFVANSKVVVDGTERSTSFISGTRLEFFMAATSALGGYDVLVRNPTPGGGDSNIVELRVVLGVVGLSSVTPNSGGTEVDLQTTFTVSWTHTTDPWRVIEHLDLRLVDADGLGLWARFTEGVSGTWSLLDSDGEVIGYAIAGTADPLESDTAILDVADSSFAGSGPTGFSMNVNFAVRFKQSAAGRRYTIELYATDDNGDIQGPDVMGTFSVGIKSVHLPLITQ